MEIREARLTDLEQLANIYNWAVLNTTASFDLVEQTVEQRAEWFGHYGGYHPLIVAVVDSKVVGYSCLSKFRQKEGYDKSVEISVYVHPEYHGMGIGTRLMREIIERGRKLGHHVIVAAITAGNGISIKMHEKMGFKCCGTFKEIAFKFGEWQDAIFLQLIL